MTSVENEIKTYFGICKFCSRYGYLKCMRTKYYYNGSVEIYADMLEKCYNIKLDNYQPSTDKICYTCVKKLRNALEFRRLLEMSLDHAVFNADFGDERMDFNVVNNLDYERMDNNIVDNPGDMFKYDIVKDEPSENDAMSLDDNEEEVYEDVEYLEDISDDNEDVNNGVIAKTIDNQTITKWPKKLPRHLRNKTYKQYTEEDLKRCVDAVKLDGMTQREAAGIFNVPRSILAVKLSANNDKKESKAPKRVWPKKLPKHLRNKTYKQYTEEDMKRCIEAVKVHGMSKKQAAKEFNIPKTALALKCAENNVEDENTKDPTYLFHQEIKALLRYTTATPYKYRNNMYYCMYCNTSDTMFDDPAFLVNHMTKKHAKDRVDKVDIMMRPHGMNEILKVDVEGLLCVECCEPIYVWNDMLNHIEFAHSVKLDQAYKRIIPYALTDEFRCVLCNESCSNYTQLDAHMNSHFNNYMCPECGDMYFSFQKLKAHLRIHAVGKYSCDICAKTFSLKKYVKNHIERIHNQGLLFKCLYCDEKFRSENCKKNHIETKHADKINPINCEVCGRVFLWRHCFKAHMKKRHRNEVHKCSECSKIFTTKYQLNEHMNVHTNTTYQCFKCERSYTAKASLRMHIKLKHALDEDSQSSNEEKGLECDYCFENFDDYRQLADHKKLHNNDYECLRCHKNYKSKTSLRMHSRLKHIREVYSKKKKT